MTDKRTHAGRLNVTTGETGDAIADANSGRMYKHIEDAISDGQMTARAQTVAICAAILQVLVDDTFISSAVIDKATGLVTRAEEWDRHERLQDMKDVKF